MIPTPVMIFVPLNRCIKVKMDTINFQDTYYLNTGNSFFGNLLTCFSKTPFATLIIQNSIVEIFFPEVRPKYIGEIQFGVSGLPQEVIADSVFSAGSDH